MYFAEASTSWRRTSSRHWVCISNIASVEEMLQQWRAVGNTTSDLAGLRFEPQTYCFKDELVTVRPTGRSNI